MSAFGLRSALAVLALAGVAFLPALGNGFTQDDTAAVERNPIVARGSVREIFTSDYWAGTGLPDRSLYRPVTVLSFALERRLTGGPSALAGHAGNLVLHALTALLLSILLSRYGAGPLATLAAGLAFASHPVHTAAVAGLVGRAEILAALFSLASLLAMSGTGSWPREASTGDPSGAIAPRVASWSAAAFLFLALGSKEVAVVAPFLLVAQELVFRPPARGAAAAWLRDRGAALAPSLLAVFCYLLLRTRAILEFPGIQVVRPMDNTLVGLHGLPRLATALSMAGRYAGLLLWPATLLPDYSGTAIAREERLLGPLPAAGSLVLGIAVLLALRGPIRRLRQGWSSAPARPPGPVPMAACLFLLPYLVVGNLVVLNGAGFAERLIYFPSTGCCMLVGTGIGWLGTRRARRRSANRILRGAGAALLGLLLTAAVARTWIAAREYRDDDTLFRRAAERSDGGVRTHFVVAQGFAAEGRDLAALAEFDKAIRNWPEHAASWLEKGELLGRRGDLRGAESALRESIRIHPMVGDSHMFLGIVLSRLDRLPEAERELRKALLLEPDLVKAAAQLGHVLFRTGRFDEAAEIYRRCVAAGRSDLRSNLEAARSRAGTPSRAAPR